MNKMLLAITAIVACLLALWLLRHKEQPEPVELAQQAHIDQPEESAPEEGAGVLAFLKAMAGKAVEKEPTVPESEPEGTEGTSAAEGGTIAGRIYDADTGEGIEGVCVYAVLDGHEVAASEGSDSSGYYRIVNLADNKYVVRYRDAQDYPDQNSTQRRTVTLSGGRPAEHIDFALVRGPRVAGKVVDSQGRPVEGAEIRASFPGSLPPAESKADGSFEFYLFSAPVTNFSLQARTDSFESEFLGPFTVFPEGLQGLTLKLTVPRNAGVSGNIVDDLGRPVAKANIRLGSLDTESEADGSFAFTGIPAGGYFIYVTEPGHKSFNAWNQQMRVELKEGQNLTGLRFVLSKDKGGLAISGKVVDTAGNPIPNAEIECLGISPQGAYSKADGSFRVTGLVEGKYHVSVTIPPAHPGYNNRSFTEATAGTDNLVIVFKGKSAIEGRVVRADTGEAVTDYELFFASARLTRLDTSILHCTSQKIHDPEGRFMLSGLSPGDATVAVKSRMFAPALVNVTLPEYETLTGVELRLEQGKPLRGLVVDALKRPVSGALVGIELHPWSHSQFTARSGADGAFVIEGFSPDVRQIYAYHPDYALASSDVSENMVIVLQKKNVGKLEVLVTSGGTPVAGAVLELMCGRDTPILLSHQRGRTGSDGTCLFEDILGKVDVTTRLSKGWFLKRTAFVEPDKTTRIELAFQPATSLEGRITIYGEPPGYAQAGLHISTLTGEEMEFGITAEPDGTYRLEGLPAGQAFLHVQAGTVGADNVGKRYNRRVELTLTAGEALHQDIDFSGEGQIKVRFLGFEETPETKGKVHGSVWILQGEVPVPEESFPTEARQFLLTMVSCASNGKCMIRNLEPGTYTLVAEVMRIDGADVDESYASQVVTIQGDETVYVDFDFR